MQTKYFRTIGLIVAILAVVLTLGVVGAQEGKVLTLDSGTSDVPGLDPALASDSQSIQILVETYIGLTHPDEVTQEVKPGLATSWDVTENADGTVTYTFHLRNDISWVRYNADSGEVEQVTDADGNVRMVTAYDVEYGWTRTLDPRTAADYSYVLYPQVVGGEAFNTQELSGAGEGVDLKTLELAVGPETLGIRAVDDVTFEATAPQLMAFQPAVFGMWMSRPQPQWVIEEFGDFWTEPENYVSYGPYAVKEWLHDESITLIKNPFWPGIDGVPVAKIDEIKLLFIDGATALAEYEAGNIDYLDTPPTADIPRIKADPVLSADYVEGTSQCTYYYGFGVNNTPMQNVHLRRAMSYALDRVDIVENVTRSGQVPAPFFSNPGLAAAPLVEEYPDLGIRYDPDMALEELDLALDEMGLSSVDELPPITLGYNTSEGHQRIAEAAQQMWVDELGIEVQLTNQEWAVFLDQRPTFPIFRAGWCSDYPDDHNFLFEVFHRSAAANNDTGWTNEEFDALVEEAAVLSDVQVRKDLYAQAENILIYEDPAIIPIYFYSDVELTKPYVERTYSTSGEQRFEKWDINR